MSAPVDFERLRCPARVIGGDPLVPLSFVPSVDLDEINEPDYDFVPDTAHFLPLEKPAACVREMVRFLDSCPGLQGVTPQ